MKDIRGVVRMWKGDQFSQNMRRIKECEVALEELMSGFVSLAQNELEKAQGKKRNLLIELN